MSNAHLETGKIIAGGEGWVLVDFGKDAFGHLSMDIDCTLPGFITASVGECLKNGRLDPAPGPSRMYYAQSLYEREEHAHLELVFPPHEAPNPRLHKSVPLAPQEIQPFRYAEIQGAFSEVKVYRHVYFGEFNDDAASFTSSDESLNKIWDFCKYSIKATNCFEHYIDGNRERLPYEADAYINQLGHFCCDAYYQKARHTIERLLQHPTWPIEWWLIMPAVVRDYVLYSGDTSSLADLKEPLRELLMEKYWLSGNLLPQKLPSRINNEEIRTIIDWPPVCRDNCEFGDGMTVPMAYLYNALLAYDELYHVPELREKALSIRENIRQNEQGLYPDYPGSSHYGLHAQFFPAYFGMTNPETYPQVLDFLRKKGMAYSVYGAQFLLGALYQLHDAETAYRLLTSPDEPGWLHMMKDGATITMEAWSNANKPNQDWNHPWGAAPANIIPRCIAGIRPIAPGFSKFIVEPQPGPLEYFTYKQPTPKGPVFVEYHRNEPVKVTLPDGTTRTFTNAQAEFSI